MDKTRFIVRARQEGATLADFLATISKDPQLEVADTIGPGPHTVVIATDAAHASAFEQRYSHSPHWMIERDRPLSLFDKTASFLHRSERNTNA